MATNDKRMKRFISMRASVIEEYAKKGEDVYVSLPLTMDYEVKYPWCAFMVCRSVKNEETNKYDVVPVDVYLLRDKPSDTFLVIPANSHKDIKHTAPVKCVSDKPLVTPKMTEKLTELLCAKPHTPIYVLWDVVNSIDVGTPLEVYDYMTSFVDLEMDCYDISSHNPFTLVIDENGYLKIT